MNRGIKLKSGALRAALGFGTALSFASLAIVPAAYAMDPPLPIKIDGGPLGELQLSGGADGLFWASTGAGSSTSYGLLGTSKSAGVEFMNGLIGLQKSDGLVQGNIIVGATNNVTLGFAPGSPSITTYATGPVFAAYITLAPSEHFSISAGRLPSLEGYELNVDWNNSNILTTAIFAVQNLQSTGVSATVTYGPVSASITFGDGFDTQVWNYVQMLGTYTFNDNNALSLYGSTNLGTTGAGAHFYGSASTPFNDSYVGYGPSSAAPFVNSSVVGGYYSFSSGNLTVVPEVQYVWAGKTPSVGLTELSGSFAAAVFANYKFGKSPWSLGGWVEYFSSNGPNNWFLNPGAKGFGLSVTPTWRGKYLFVRGNAGFLHLTQVSNTGVPSGYGADLKGRNQAIFLAETGVLF